MILSILLTVATPYTYSMDTYHHMHTATHCDTLQYTGTLQHAATHYTPQMDTVFNVDARIL